MLGLPPWHIARSTVRRWVHQVATRRRNVRRLVGRQLPQWRAIDFPFVCAAIRHKAEEKPGLDWWGVNYYSRGAITPFMLPAHAPGELMTDMKVRRFVHI